MAVLLRIVLAVAFVAAAAPVRADEAQDEVGVPIPERVEEAASSEAPVVAEPTGTPAYERDVAPIAAVQRPSGVWGPLAVAADLLVMRPIGFVSLFAGSAAFVVVSPVAAATQTLGDRADALSERAHDVFTRPLGAL
jgi:hypothetical protein